jgi:hypothetical protein
MNKNDRPTGQHGGAYLMVSQDVQETRSGPSRTGSCRGRWIALIPRPSSAGGYLGSHTFAPSNRPFRLRHDLR